MSPYFLAFSAAAFLDSFPAFVPPSWVALVVLQVRFGMNVWLATVVGVAGSATGRLILSTYVHRAAEHILSRHAEHNIRYLGETLKGKAREDFLFVFLYCLTPLSTAPLFLGASMAGVPRLVVFPPFASGKLVNYAVMLLAGRQAAPDIERMLRGRFSWPAAAMALLSLALVAAMVFVDWHALLRDKKLRLELDLSRFLRRRRPPKLV